MHRSIRWFAVALAILLFAGALVWTRGNGLPRVPLGGSRELRVLKVSLGTNHVLSAEPRWKQALRRALPTAWQKKLGPLQVDQFQTRYESLVVWLGEFNAQTGQPLTASLYRPETVFTDGYAAPAQRRRGFGRMSVEFTCFERQAKKLRLRMRDGTNPVSFVVDNPRPVRPAAWIARSLPQTNQALGTEVVLKQLFPYRGNAASEQWCEVSLRARSLSEGRTGWIAWRVTAFDVWGNWADGRFALSWASLPRLPVLPPGISTWKLVVDGQEYLSAGYVPPPTNGACVVLTPDLRAETRGVRGVVLVGGGAYRISNHAAVQTGNNPLSPGSPTLAFSPLASGTNWMIDLTTFLPGLLCVSEANGATPVLSARLHERMALDGGRIFSPTTAIAVTNHASKQIAQFFPIRLQNPATNLEVEVIVTLPPTEFFIAPGARAFIEGHDGQRRSLLIRLETETPDFNAKGISRKDAKRSDAPLRGQFLKLGNGARISKSAARRK